MRARIRALRLVVVLALAIDGRSVATGAAAPQTSAQLTVPAHVDLLSARIHEEPPFEPSRMAQRVVVFTLSVADQPRCTEQTKDVEYAFLIDTDGRTTTGVRLAAFPELGVEAKIAMHCDPRSGRFVSRSGTVQTRPDPDRARAHLVELRARLGDLPSAGFRWIAVAKQGDVFTRVPESRTARWLIYEAVIW